MKNDIWVVFVMWKCHLRDFQKNIKHLFMNNSDFYTRSNRLTLTQELTCRTSRVSSWIRNFSWTNQLHAHVEVSELAKKNDGPNFLKVVFIWTRKQRLLGNFFKRKSRLVNLLKKMSVKILNLSRAGCVHFLGGEAQRTLSNHKLDQKPYSGSPLHFRITVNWFASTSITTAYYSLKKNSDLGNT